MKTQIIDLKPGGRYKTPQGYMVFPTSVLGRTGIQEYDSGELGQPAGKTVTLDRPESEVFKPESMASFEAMPVTMNHPDSLEVDAKTWRDLAVGMVKNVRREADYLVGDIWVYDAKAIAGIERDDIEEISLGYSSDVVEGGADGADYTQTDIEGNHAAILPRGRCGGECRLGDQQLTNKRSNPVSKKTLLDSLLGRLGLTKPTAEQKTKLSATLNDMGVDPEAEIKDEENPKPIEDTGDDPLKTDEELNKPKVDTEEQLKDEGGEALATAQARVAELEAQVASLQAAKADSEETRTVAADAAMSFKGLTIGDADTARSIREKAVALKGLYTADAAKKLADCDLKAAYQMARTLRDHSLGRAMLGDSKVAAKSVDYNALYK
ncbi:MAG: DUF2213 domain-containing protein [Burkholderiaceae bacterium]|nr:DUF2213 domain-containing protein [Burkholderiaceae bacterium]